MRPICKLFLVPAAFLALCAAIFADADQEAAKARMKTGSLIVCSPDGKKPDTVALEEGIKRLRPGSVLRLLPGAYNPQELPMIDVDGVIFEGDGSGGFVDLPLIIYGRDCVVRNIFLRGLEGEDMVVVDSKFHGVAITSGDKRGKPVIYNCCMNSLAVYPNAQNVTVKYCSVVRGHDIPKEAPTQKVAQTWTYSTHTWTPHVYSIVYLGTMLKRGDLSIQNSVLYSEGHIFFRGNKLLDLFMQDNIVYCGASLVAVPFGESGIKEMKSLKDYFQSRLKGVNDTEKPKFQKEPSKSNWWSLERDQFVLVSQLPQGVQRCGVNMGPKGVPIPDAAK